MLYEFYNKNKNNNFKTIYSIKTFYNDYPYFNIEFYKIFNNLLTYNDEEIIIHFNEIGLKLNLKDNEFKKNILKSDEFSPILYRKLNKDLEHLKEKDLIHHYFNNAKNENRIYSIQSFYNIYSFLDFNEKSHNYNYNVFVKNNKYNNFTEEEKIIFYMTQGIYEYIHLNNKNVIGRIEINNIYEALIDLSYTFPKNKLTPGISLIIRSKNEEKNIKECIDSVIDLVDEIIFVDNNSNDKTYEIVKDYQIKYSNIKLYKYNIDVSKVGIEHQNSIKNNNKNTLATFYNWCLSKATKYNVFKWDADFICIRNNFIQMIDKYNLKKRDDKFAIWFTGKTLFENNEKYYYNHNSYYNEFRIFSYKNNFCWYDGDTCEYTEPYLKNCNNKYRYDHPIFFELKRTSIDEFKERSSLIDKRDIDDYNILDILKKRK